MEPQKIKSKLIERGISQNEIALKLNIKRQAVSKVINLRGRSRKVEKAISDSIGLPVTKVFPGKRRDDGR